MKNTQINQLETIKKGIFGVHVTTWTEPRMNKTNNPFFGRVRKVTDYSNVALGTSYENTVNRRLERAGFCGGYQASKPNGKAWYNDYLYVSDKDPNQFYLKIIKNRNSHTESRYMLDGRLATNEECAQIEAFIPVKNECAKQSNAGLVGENQVKEYAPKLQNVIKITFNGRVIE